MPITKEVGIAYNAYKFIAFHHWDMAYVVFFE